MRSWTIDAARAEANRLRVQVDRGDDPRELDRQRAEERRVDAVRAAVEALAVREVWDEYVEARRARWGVLHHRDHIAKAKPGGAPAQRGTRGRGQTVGGPLHPLMVYRLADLTPAVLSEWAAQESLTRPTATRLSWRLLRGFLNWCAEHPEYAAVLPLQNPAKAKAVREQLGTPRVKQDALQREQLKAWFAAVRQLPNITAAAYLQVLLLTGARPGELLALRWDDVNWKWKGLNIRDKVEGERTIPLTPYVAYVLNVLPRLNEWVFATRSDDEELRRKANEHAPQAARTGLRGGGHRRADPARPAPVLQVADGVA